jgi:hypothetical protein
MEETIATETQKKKDEKKGCISMVIIAIVLFFVVKSCVGDTKTMNTSISFTGTQFVITNNDSITYSDVNITLNGIYHLQVDYFPANKVYTVGILQFADDAGNRFKLGMKPQKITISGIDPEGDKSNSYLEYK